MPKVRMANFKAFTNATAVVLDDSWVKITQANEFHSLSN